MAVFLVYLRQNMQSGQLFDLHHQLEGLVIHLRLVGINIYLIPTVIAPSTGFFLAKIRDLVLASQRIIEFNAKYRNRGSIANRPSQYRIR